MLKRLRRGSELAEWLSIRNASIRGKVTVALAGVLALLLPQIFLTVAYMVDLFGAGERIERLSAITADVDRVVSLARDVFLEPLPRDPADLASRRVSLTAVAAGLTGLQEELSTGVARDIGLAPYLMEVAQLRDLVATYGSRLAGEVELLSGRPEPIPNLEGAMQAFAAEIDTGLLAWHVEYPDPTRQQLEARVADLERAAAAVVPMALSATIADDWWSRQREAEERDAEARMRKAASNLLARLSGLQQKLALAQRDVGMQIRADVDAANRYLLTLVLLTLVYLTVIILVLPGRLVRPLEHLRAVMERAGYGHLDARARVAGDDEMGRLGDAFNHMLRRLETFDELKRDRILDDRQRIRDLAAQVPHPLALLDTHLRLAHANPPFRELFGLETGYEDTDVTDLVEGPDANAFRQLLERALRHRPRGRRRILELPDGDRTVRYTASVSAGRNRHGRVAWLMVQLEPLG